MQPESNRLPPNQQLIRSKRWPIVGEKAPAQLDAPWSVQVTGEVEQPVEWTLEKLQTWATDELITDVHCVTRWSRYDMRFGGVWLERLLAMVTPTVKANYVSFVARSTRSHSTSLPLSELSNSRAMLVLTAEGAPLPVEHGGPIRMVVPGRYFYKSVKWLKQIDLLQEDRLGYWEAETGYHNTADPWLEQRFLAPTLSKREAAQLISMLDFSDRDLRSLEAQGRDLRQLNAQRALLRNADFRDCRLESADFREANLSNARLSNADLRGATFAGADLDGADFAGADLRGVNLEAGSMFGTSFCEANDPQGRAGSAAIVDSSTTIARSLLDALTDEQRQWIESQSCTFLS